MAEYWTGRKWISDKGKSVADTIDIPKKYKGSQGKGQIYSTILPKACFNETYQGKNPYRDTIGITLEDLEECNIHILINRRGKIIIYHGAPNNLYPEYFLSNE